MAGSSWSGFAKSVLIPMLIALAIYVVLFLIILPLYRRHRSRLARYSHYTPLSSNLAQHTTSLFEPYLIEPSKTMVQRLRDLVANGIRRFVIRSSWPSEHRYRRSSQDFYDGDTDLGENEDDHLEHRGLFDAENGEAMVGFDGQHTRRGHDNSGADTDVDNSNRRLSRELEEGFRDDSGSEASDEEVTVGRRTVSRRASEVRR